MIKHMIKKKGLWTESIYGNYSLAVISDRCVSHDPLSLQMIPRMSSPQHFDIAQFFLICYKQGKQWYWVD